MKVIVMRAISGAGKTTLAKKITKQGGTICLADDYFLGRKFNPAELSNAHKACMRAFLAALGSGTELVVVDNTNTQLWEATPYVSVAEAMGYEVEIHEIVCDVEVAAARNVHGVPANAVRGMARRWEKSLPWWNVVVHKEAK